MLIRQVHTFLSILFKSQIVLTFTMRLVPDNNAIPTDLMLLAKALDKTDIDSTADKNEHVGVEEENPTIKFHNDDYISVVKVTIFRQEFY